MSYNKISFIFVMILFISLPDFIYSYSYSYTFKSQYNQTDMLCANNKIKILFNRDIEIYEGDKFDFSGSRNSIWAFATSNFQYLRASMVVEKLLEDDDFESTFFKRYLCRNSEIKLLPEVTSLEDFFNVNQFRDKLDTIDFGWFDFSKVTNFKNAFKGLVNLKTIKFKSNWKRCDSQKPPLNNKPKPIVMTSMLQGCTSLVSIDLTDFDTSSVEDMSLLFYGCTELRAINISNFNFINENITQDMLSGLEKLQYINLANVEGYINQIPSDIFYNNTELIVCQGQQIIQPDDHICCDIKMRNGQVECKPSSNFIIL